MHKSSVLVIAFFMYTGDKQQPLTLVIYVSDTELGGNKLDYPLCD